jgi:PAS domain S-box-containing protein
MSAGPTEGTPPSVSHRLVFEAAPDGILIVDGEGTIREANPQAARMLGYDPGELEGMEVERLVPTSLRGAHHSQREEYMADPHPRPMGVGLALKALRKDGRELPVEISLSPCSTAEGRFVIAVVRDVSERNRLRALGAGTLRAAEEERRRIARELHDDTAQYLAALLVRLHVLRRTEDPEGRRVLLDEMQEELSAAVEGVRRISRGLRPPALEDVGVEAAIRSHVRSMAEVSDLSVELTLDQANRVTDPEVQLVVYRVVQEAMTNVVRHADADRAQIVLDRDGEELVVRVADDGRGFDADQVLLDGRGLGLLGMDERARLVGGRLKVTSEPGRGTRVELRLPLPEESSHV